MEDNRLRIGLLTAVAPVTWGSNYVVAAELLPPDRPLFAATMRALPAGLLLLIVLRRLPIGIWWWRSAVLGACNIAAFFPLVFVAAFELPSGLAATLQATAPLAMMALAWPLIGERPIAVRLVAAVVGLVGVAFLVLRTPGGASGVGLLASLASVLVSALGFVLLKRWRPPVDMLTVLSWQLVLGGLMLVPVWLVVEGVPASVGGREVAGLTYIALISTVLGFWCWYRGLASLPAGSVGLIGLLNPVAGTLLGVAIAGELFGWAQALGMALVLGSVVAGQGIGSGHGSRAEGQGLRRHRGRPWTGPGHRRPAGRRGGAGGRVGPVDDDDRPGDLCPR